MRILLYVILLFQSINLFGQEIRPKVEKIAESISEGNRLEDKRVGLGGSPSNQYIKFEKLKKIATEKELLLLLQHESAAVKGYASWALIDKQYNDLTLIFNKFLETEETVKTFSGCIISTDHLALVFYSRVLYPENSRSLTAADKAYFATQIKNIYYSALRFKKDNYVFQEALENNQANPDNYNIIRKLALKYNAEKALIALAAYKKEADINDILAIGTAAFEAMSYFPNPKFWDFLMQHKTTINSEAYYSAIAAFKNESSLAVLTSIYSKNKESETALYKALMKFYAPIYEDLLLQIFEDTKTIDIIQLKRVLKNAPEKSAPYFVNGLLSDQKNNFLELDYNYGSRDSILPLLLKNIQKYQPKRLSEVCVHNVSKVKFTELASLLEIISEHKIVAAKEPILVRLQKKTYPFETFHLTKALLSFDDKSIHKEIKRTLLASQENWDIGNWSASFRELLNKHDIEIK
ncbi:hypothetical protein H2O64_22865 [Kordia sp. YSTF-M3]|uniref:HEAT repeat domain-containing protein n=1 Tax=Kordia aestuariivivens TaxID=2759037 RepID=A0ABR7QG28_9FLAO|nr:hypothetical protein [Kordia aestuariivivens]MBC8757530.1 hypothetical protein [Kordia aestuariivivens]